MKKSFEDVQNFKEGIKINSVHHQLLNTFNQTNNEDYLSNCSSNVFAKPSQVAVKKKKIYKKAQQKQSKKSNNFRNVSSQNFHDHKIYQSITKHQLLIEAETTTCFAKHDLLTRRNSLNESNVETEKLKTDQKTTQIPLKQILINEFLNCTQIKIDSEIDFLQQQNINAKMRSILVRWLYQVALSFKLKGETFFLAIQTLDDYTQKKMIKREEYQLIGVTALFMAGKAEEIYPPKMKKYVTLGQQSYTREQILQMEFEILMTLDFKLKFNSAYSLLSLLKVVENVNQRTIDTALFLANAGLIKSHACTQNYGIHAIGALNLACELTNEQILFEKLCVKEWFPSWDFLAQAKQFQQSLNLQQCLEKFFEFMQTKTNYSSYLFKI